MIPYGRQFIDEEDIRAVVEVLRSDFITQGPKVREFEEKLADYCGAKYAVVFNSGTSALISAYSAVGLSEGDEFITSPITFVATANAGILLGAKPIFCDVEPDTGNMDPDKLEDLISPKTKLIVPVHYGGHPADMERIRDIADRYGLKVVEDACHALGAEYRGSKVGSSKYSEATVFSFHPVKHITTGEGGAVLTNDEEIYRKLLLIRNHGITKDPSDFKEAPEGGWYYEMQSLGYNFRMTDFQAVLGISQLRKLPEFVRRRREIAELYGELLSGMNLIELPVEKPYALNSYHLFPIRVKEKAMRKELFDHLRSSGIGVQVHYIPVYWHPFYRELGYKRGICPIAEDFYSREISLPIYPKLSEGEIEFMVRTISDFGEHTDAG
ncbi:MAG: UDP-4-amino-4,6-dideoxy-N-acetyl-beta-L-altrosamine transaminase [Aquificota bacterium]|nr:UDP-4-amino-4,6-dideoxy-N-acetyl-beta-L-altrosamine transaminase [Aquificota bacterium]